MNTARSKIMLFSAVQALLSCDEKTTVLQNLFPHPLNITVATGSAVASPTTSSTETQHTSLIQSWEILILEQSRQASFSGESSLAK